MKVLSNNGDYRSCAHAPRTLAQVALNEHGNPGAFLAWDQTYPTVVEFFLRIEREIIAQSTN